MNSYDVIIIGVGGMGSSACFHFAQAGQRVLGLEQFGKAHDRGSSHGELRLIRQAYFEGGNYVPLLKEAYRYWDHLAKLADKKIFDRAGLLIAGPEAKADAVRGALQCAQTYGVDVTRLTGAEIRERFSQFRFPEDFCGVYEPEAGFLRVEDCVSAYCEQATVAGATLQFHEKVLSWKADGRSVEVKTEKGTYTAARLVLCAGAWSSKLLADLNLPLKVHRVPQFWFEAESHTRRDLGMPCFAFDLPHCFVYGFPQVSGGVLKIAEHRPGAVVTDPYFVDRRVSDDDVLNVKTCISNFLPGVKSSYVRASVCMYTLTPDEHFIVDQHPEYANVSFAAGFSGHGFKFASVIGAGLAGAKLNLDFLKIRWNLNG